MTENEAPDPLSLLTLRLRAAQAQRDSLLAAIRLHRDQHGDDRCWQDDETLYKALPEGYTPPEREVAVELAACERYIRCRRNPATEYVSPQREIERLQTELAAHRKRLSECFSASSMEAVLADNAALREQNDRLIHSLPPAEGYNS